MSARAALIAATLATALSSAMPGTAQENPWPRAEAMGGADLALARGYAAIEWNPANLFLEDSVAFSFGSTVYGGRISVTGASLGEMADIITAAGSGPASLLDGIPEEGLRVDAVSEGLTATRIAERLELPDPSGGATVPSMAFTYKNGGFAWRHQTVVSAVVSRELADLAVNGFNPERIDEYAARDTRLRIFSVASLTFGMGKPLTEHLSAGFAVRWVFGRKLVTGRVFEPEIDVDAERLTAQAAAVETRGGRGFGLDLGLTYRRGQRLFVSAALRNVIQRMHWSEDLYFSQAALDQDDLGSTDLTDLIDRFRAREFDPAGTTLEAYAAGSTLFQRSFLPRVGRLGVGYRTHFGTRVQLTGQAALGRGSLVPPRPDGVVLGVEHPWSVLRLRGGLALEEGGVRRFTGGFGLRLAALEFDVAAGYTSGGGNDSPVVRGFSASVGMGFLFLGDRVVR